MTLRRLSEPVHCLRSRKPIAVYGCLIKGAVPSNVYEHNSSEGLQIAKGIFFLLHETNSQVMRCCPSTSSCTNKYRMLCKVPPKFSRTVCVVNLTHSAT